MSIPVKTVEAFPNSVFYKLIKGKELGDKDEDGYFLVEIEKDMFNVVCDILFT